MVTLWGSSQRDHGFDALYQFFLILSTDSYLGCSETLPIAAIYQSLLFCFFQKKSIAFAFLYSLWQFSAYGNIADDLVFINVLHCCNPYFFGFFEMKSIAFAFLYNLWQFSAYGIIADDFVLRFPNYNDLIKKFTA